MPALVSFWLILIFAFFIQNSECGRKGQRLNQIACRNEKGDPVDWFIVYKLPRTYGNRRTNGYGGSGFEYLYMDGSTSGQWKRSNVSIQDQGQSVGYTINQYYANKNNGSILRLLYNDENPDGNVSFTKGHTKGALVFDTSSGFWLIHSVPKFPPKDAYTYPPTGAKYGQTFFCISFPYSSLNEIASQLIFYEPYIYDYAVPVSILSDNKALQSVIMGTPPKQAPFCKTTTVVSVGGVSLTSFAKHKKWSKELYADLVAPTLSKGLYVESWQNGRGDIGSNCTASYRVYNIAELTLMPNLAFSNHEDHSKWTVTNETTTDRDQNGRWICIGDINRQKEQFFRSGGTMCMQNDGVWETFRGSIQRFEDCPTHF